MDGFLTSTQVAAELGVSPRTVTYWCKQKEKGPLPHAFQLPIGTGTGRVWLIPASDLEGFEKPGAPGVGRPRKDGGSEAT